METIKLTKMQDQDKKFVGFLVLNFWGRLNTCLLLHSLEQKIVAKLFYVLHYSL